MAGLRSLPAGDAARDRLGEQRLLPERDQPLPVEVPGMEAPEAHKGNIGIAGRGLKQQLVV